MAGWSTFTVGDSTDFMTKANIMLLCESTSKMLWSDKIENSSRLLRENQEDFQISEAIAQSGKNIFNLVGQKTQLMVE